MLRDHLEKLHAFRVVARAGGITRAAKELAMSQAALSHAIKTLEDSVGATLLLRTRAGVELTDAGRLLFDFSKRLFVDLDSVEANLKRPAEKNIGKLRVGTHETLAIHLWPDFLERFHARFPQITVTLLSGRIDDLVRGLVNRDFHAVVSVEPIGNPELAVRTLLESRLAFFAAPSSFAHRYPALKKKRLTAAEAREIPILTDNSAHVEQYHPIPRLLATHGFTEDPLFELNSFEASIRLAAKGLGIAVLPLSNAGSSGLREITIAGIPKTFGRYRLSASMLKNPTPLTLTLVEELHRFFR